MANMVDRVYFQELAEKRPDDVCKRALCAYDEEHKCYVLTVWGEEYRIFPHDNRIVSMGNPTKNPHGYFDLFAVHYLNTARDVEMRNEWISEKDLAGGPTFFRGPHHIPTHILTNGFNDDVRAFNRRCRMMDGIPINMADAAYVFHVTDRIPVAVLYWVGDDEFPAESKILYDRTISDHLALDIVYALAVGVCEVLGADLTG